MSSASPRPTTPQDVRRGGGGVLRGQEFPWRCDSSRTKTEGISLKETIIVHGKKILDLRKCCILTCCLESRVRKYKHSGKEYNRRNFFFLRIKELK